MARTTVALGKGAREKVARAKVARTRAKANAKIS